MHRPLWLRGWQWLVGWIATPVLGWDRRTVAIWGGDPPRGGERPEDLRFDVALLGESVGGPIVGLAVIGFYPPGSAGSEHADVIRRRVADLRRDLTPAAVLIDLTRLRYVWGDGLAHVLQPLFFGTGSRSPAVALVATGRTGEAVRPVFGVSFSRNTGARLFDDRGAALRFLVAETTARAEG